MGTLSFWHILVVAAVVVVVFAHRRLPAAMGALGALIGHWRRSAKGPRPRRDDGVIEGTFTRRDE
ncbi:twin-arginine translocase TatA/TatE family subunit [Rhizomicrobium electricum]|uniref:Sec-independent protein translocase protein TatA n=1 Tax=Rhizomicrobium electricum TaxID=480070 RepID=A0ABN1E7L3_9PROT|nr:twin-arginine translocase TatA/TatE family subunit [Rhizomicrobium electricum]NIJ47866.1 Sec-independent protein translocase protein TatA [Rhizomicrobium electricum]